ncbi:LysE family transporter [Persicobacter psychrovividus]|uniref:Threonine/homoserine/homoserine lactone efflux protein n=1 Tax=Persicobacter psychrovividus TaxID=387638 RepID=A0ABN6LFK0_9BACT|nr:hypothetical protein PEPS_40260 [Persicobacter psychrovividus]
MGFGGSFVGAIPLGPINMSILKASAQRDIQSAKQMCFGAATVELLFGSVALLIGAMFIHYLDAHPIIRGIIGGILVLIGLVVLLLKPKSSDKESYWAKFPAYFRGIIVALLNPQAIPYWVLIFTLHPLTQHQEAQHYITLALFLIGVFCGKYAILRSYSVIGMKYSDRLMGHQRKLNAILGIIFIFIGLMQVRFLF